MTSLYLADAVSDAVIATDASYRITQWNAAAARLFGWHGAEAMGRDSLAWLRLSFADASLAHVQRTVAEAGRWTGVVTATANDGSTVIAEGVVAGLPDGDGYVLVVRASRTHHRPSGETRTRAAEPTAPAFAEQLLAAAPVGISSYALTGACLSCNAAAAHILGGSVDQLVGQSFRTLGWWQQSGLLDLAERAIATRAAQAAEIRMVTPYGRSVWIFARLAIVRARDDDVLLVVISDITDQKRVEEDLHGTARLLRDSQVELRKLSRVIEQSPASVVITNRDGVIEYVNPSFSAMSGYLSDDVIGRNPRMFKSGDLTADAYRVLWSTITNGGTWRGEMRNRRRTGELYWVRANIFPIFDDDGAIAHFVGIHEHIGAEKAAERAALDSEQRFQRAHKMEALGQLAGGIAHDFNNLLTAILGYSDFVATSVRDQPEIAQDVEQIKKAGERAARLTRQLLAFSRRQRLDPENLSLNRIVDDLMQMVGRVIGEHIRLEVATDAALGLASLDPGQVEQVIMNLVVNARDAMPAGGRLAIRTANVDLDDEFVAAHPGSVAGPCVSLVVSDSGSGMSPEVLSHMFEPFFTTKPAGQGTGLGLATVYGIVKQSRGYIDVDSRPGVGTTFTVHFPRLEADTVASPLGTPSAELRGTETVLLAEDEDALRQVVQRVLQHYGYLVLVAADGAAALEVEAGYLAPIDLLLSDVVMPALDGRDLAERLVRRRPRMKVLYMSGFADPPAFPPPSGVSAALLPKPFTPEALARKVREVLSRPAPDRGNRI